MSETMTAAHLRAAANLIGDPERWCRDADARDARNRPTMPSSERAVRWCAVGALEKVRAVTITFWDFRDLDRLDADRPPLSTLNDTGGHATAVAELRRLADLAEAREGTVGA